MQSLQNRMAELKEELNKVKQERLELAKTYPKLAKEFQIDVKANQKHEKIVEKVNVIEFMKQGSPMLKYGKYGYPHFKYFEVNNELTHLIWYSKHKKLNQTRISISDICKIQRKIFLFFLNRFCLFVLFLFFSDQTTHFITKSLKNKDIKKKTKK